jgi:predicted MFS family arabinose efflux permease
LTVLGPIVGGIVVDTISWRVAFLINVPLLAVALWATLAHVEESRDTDAAAKFDWLGAVVAALAVGGLSFGLIRGQSNDWADTAAWVAIGVGTLALIAFPILMARRKNPLVPLDLFRQRAFATINLATFFIYGALYVTITFQALMLQGVLGYTALAAGAVGIPVGIMLSVLSTWIGTLSARMGARRFLVGGPMFMAASMLWYARLPADSEPWKAAIESPGTLLPPVSTLVDVLPAVLLFGLGISMVVAPLTSTLMSSIPGRFSGLGSAINNSISRVGQPLLGAIIFIAISASFYGSLAAKAPDLDTGSADVRAAFQPLNPPPETATQEQVTAATQASIDGFHLSMIVIAALLVLGGLVSWFGLRGGATEADG